MRISNKEKYKKLCEIEDSIPLFSQYWWMDAVSQGYDWDVLLVERGGSIVATMPYMLKIKNDYRYIMQPLLTQTNGIWIKYPQNQKYEARLSYERNIIAEIIEKLEDLRIDYYNQKFDFRFTNWLPFYWKKYTQTTRYTYRIENNNYNKEQFYSNYSSNTRKNLRKSSKIVDIEMNELKIDEFYNLNNQVFIRQNKKNPISYDFLVNLDKECVKNNSRIILSAKDKKGNLHSAIYLVWDKYNVYYILSGSDNNYRSSQSLSLLLNEGIKFALNMGKSFDFEGSMIKPIEIFFASFGAKQIPYFHIMKEFNDNGTKLVSMMERGEFI